MCGCAKTIAYADRSFLWIVKLDRERVNVGENPHLPPSERRATGVAIDDTAAYRERYVDLLLNALDDEAKSKLEELQAGIRLKTGTEYPSQRSAVLTV